MLLVRHGETEWNLEGRYQGGLDSPLTERGVAQAHAIGRLLGTLPEAVSAAIVASPLGRARRTAEIIRGHLAAETKLEFDDRLREISLGSWDGLTRHEIAARSPGIFAGDGRREWYFRSPDGETDEGFSARIGEWLSEPVEARVLIVVTHGVVSRILRGQYAGLAREAALRLAVPQDGIFRLTGGAIEAIAAPIGPAKRGT